MFAAVEYKKKIIFLTNIFAVVFTFLKHCHLLFLCTRQLTVADRQSVLQSVLKAGEVGPGWSQIFQLPHLLLPSKLENI